MPKSNSSGRRSRTWLAATAAAACVIALTSTSQALARPSEPSAQPAAGKAAAAKPAKGHDRLSGQVPIEDQISGRSQRPYRNNMRLVGQDTVHNRGMNGNLGWLDNCAYMSSYFGDENKLEGLAVIDASNPRDPRTVKIMPGNPGTRESQVEANKARRIVIVMPFTARTPFGDPPGVDQLQIYQAGSYCGHLKRVGTYDFGDFVTHEFRISEDGNTVYVTSISGEGPAISVVDISDLAHPELVTTWDPSMEGMPEGDVHDLDVNRDGTRAYVAMYYDDGDGVQHGGLGILDTSEVEHGGDNPQLHLISTFFWQPAEELGIPHTAQLIHVAGRPYIVSSNEVFNTVGCPWGWARIIDISNEKYPLQISSIRLEVSQRRNCPETTRDDAMYSSHYIGIDNVMDTKMVYFTWYSSGIRAWDVTDPYDPKEVGYYISGAKTDTKFKDDRPTRFGNNRVDYTYDYVRYRPATREIWFTSVYNGFQIVKLIDDPLHGHPRG